MQGPRNEFELTGAINWWLVNCGQGKRHFYCKILRMRKKSAKVLKKSTKNKFNFCENQHKLVSADNHNTNH